MRVPPALALALAVACVGCASGGATFADGVDPSPAFAVSIAPSTLSFVSPLTTVGCPIVSPFVTNFRVVVVAGSSDLTFHQIGIQLIDGSHVGGPGVVPLLMGSRDLVNMFGTLTIPANTRRDFGFQPRFGCGFSHPHSLLANTVFIDRSGLEQAVALSAPIF